MIEKGGWRGSGISMLIAHDDDNIMFWNTKFALHLRQGKTCSHKIVTNFWLKSSSSSSSCADHMDFLDSLSISPYHPSLLASPPNYLQCQHRAYVSKFWLVNLHGAFNKFPDFFVQAFKIVVDSWKFSMLLLYTLWDDWPMFLISGSNQQPLQQLEYTLLKPDCHRWWISKMQSGFEDTLEEWHAIKLCFKLGKNATETYGMLQTAFRPSYMNRASVFEWHKRFTEAREYGRDDERCGRSKEVNRPELIGQTVRVRVRVTMLRF